MRKLNDTIHDVRSTLMHYSFPFFFFFFFLIIIFVIVVVFHLWLDETKKKYKKILIINFL